MLRHCVCPQSPPINSHLAEILSLLISMSHAKCLSRSHASLRRLGSSASQIKITQVVGNNSQ